MAKLGSGTYPGIETQNKRASVCDVTVQPRVVLARKNLLPVCLVPPPACSEAFREHLHTQGRDRSRQIQDRY